MDTRDPSREEWRRRLLKAPFPPPPTRVSTMTDYVPRNYGVDAFADYSILAKKPGVYVSPGGETQKFSGKFSALPSAPEVKSELCWLASIVSFLAQSKQLAEQWQLIKNMSNHPFEGIISGSLWMLLARIFALENSQVEPEKVKI